MRRKDDEKEKSIKEAVIKLILREGFHGASISKIAKIAGVSPATVYIYYENKENMLQDIYREYSEEIFDYVLARVEREMNARMLIEKMVISYYTFIKDHEEIFNFVEQFSACPSLIGACAHTDRLHDIYDLMQRMKNSRMIKDYQNDTLMAIIFYPVKAISLNKSKTEDEKKKQLYEMIEIIQDTLLV